MSDVTARSLRAGAQPAHAPRSLRSGLRVVRPSETSPRIRRRRARLAICSLFALVAAGLFGLVALHVVLTQNQFRLDNLRSQATTEEAKYQRLRLEVAQLESPQRIVAEAQQRLGMVQPPTVTYLTPVNPAPAAADSSTPPGPALAAGTDPTGWTEVKPKLAPGR
jgi:cell division protein FtsL